MKYACYILLIFLVLCSFCTVVRRDILPKERKLKRDTDQDAIDKKIAALSAKYKGNVKPACEYNTTCSESKCSCCGDCNEHTAFICRKNQSMECARFNVAFEHKKTKISNEEKTKAKEFFRHVKMHTNTTYDDVDIRL